MDGQPSLWFASATDGLWMRLKEINTDEIHLCLLFCVVTDELRLRELARKSGFLCQY
jgi:hypothetical protein